jgi:hypothetical protein
MSNKSASDVINRIQIALGVKSDNELCSTLSIGRSTLGGWRSRDSVPYALCVSLAEDKKLSLDWLLTGEGEMLREKPSHLQAVATPKRRITDKEGMLERRAEKMAQLMAQLSEEQQKEMFFIIEEKCEFNQLKHKVQELEQRATG